MSLLVDNNDEYPEVQWNTPVSHLIRDDFVLEDEYATTHTTIEDILSHRSGLPRHELSYGGHYDGHNGRPVDVVRSLRYLPLTAEPRTKFQYCNLMFLVAAHVIESLTDTWLGDVLHEKIWKPLDMKSTVSYEPLLNWPLEYSKSMPGIYSLAQSFIRSSG
jgi:CubicO group peptidase (beta-lactamase class C family)